MNDIIGYTPDTTGKINVSATQIERFFYSPASFYASVINKELSTPTSATILGTIVHYVLGLHLSHQLNVEKNKETISEYITDNFSKGYITEEEKAKIIEHWKPMVNEAMRWCSENINYQMVKSEQRLVLCLDKEADLYLNGTYDCLNINELIDFKTTSRLSDEKDIPSYYLTQLYIYSHLIKENGGDFPKFLSNVFITVPRVGEISEKSGKPLQDYPCRVYKITREFNVDEYNKVVNKINLVKEALLTPEKYHKVIFRLIDEKGGLDD